MPPSDETWGRGRNAVIKYLWQDAKDYAQWLSGKSGKRYRLPTESEWSMQLENGGMEEIWAGYIRQRALT